MRRLDRETDENIAWNIFHRAQYASLALITKSCIPYCVPISFAVSRDNTSIYFHSANSGLKLDCIHNNSNVCLSAVADFVADEESYSMKYESAIVFGNAVSVADISEKMNALRLICEKYAPSNMKIFDEYTKKYINQTTIIKIDVTHITGKRNY